MASNQNRMNVHRALLTALLVTTFLWASLLAPAAFGQSLAQSMTFWRSAAYTCTATGVGFPSKENPDPNAADRCDDGDMTLFNGLMCAAGEQDGCRGVELSQASNGRWWRSPRRIGLEAPANDVSFSPDQALGMLLYLTEKRDAARFDRWLYWVEANRPCLLEMGNLCFQKGWYRMCTDDADKRCTFRPANCVMIEQVGTYLGRPWSGCRQLVEQARLPSEIFLPSELNTFLGAHFNEPGYPTHLAGVEIFLLRKLGKQSDVIDAAAKKLAAREPRNAFFQYLAEGPTQRVKDIVLELCPSQAVPSRLRFQWSWERTDAEQAYRDSMYWDCIFMGRLLGA